MAQPPAGVSATTTRWWGWGTLGTSFPLTAEAASRLFDVLGIAPRTPSPSPSIPPLPASRRLDPPGATSIDAFDRLVHCAGKSTPDLLRWRMGRVPHAPDAIVRPRSAAEVAALLAWAGRESVAVVPFGGGSSVVGGVAPVRGRHRAVVTMDLRALDRVLAIDATSGLARVEGGVLGPALEAALGARGFSLGHFPQSFEHSTLGGWLATRSAGQNSTLHGKIEDMAAAVTAITPCGEIATREVPATATGPELREALLGSEGTLGVLVEAVVRIHRCPQTTRYASYLFRSFAEGVTAARAILQQGLRPAVLRLSDERETELHMALAGADRSFGVRALRALGKADFVRGAHLMVGFEGQQRAVNTSRRLTAAAIRRAGGLSIGGGPGRRWERERFALPYLRDALLDLGILTDTLETATTWSRLPALYRAVRDALATPIVMCHVSHCYPDGASLYFTFVMDAPDPEQALEAWRQIKRAAGDAILAHGGTISHHHAVGIDHLPWLAAERGEGQMRLLRALKRAADPGGILNPGKLIPEV